METLLLPHDERVKSIRAHARAISLEDLNKQTAKLHPVGLKQYFSFSSDASAKWRQRALRVAGVLIATGVLLWASNQAGKYTEGPAIKNGTTSSASTATDDFAEKASSPLKAKGLSSMTAKKAAPSIASPTFEVPTFDIEALQPSPEYMAFLKEKEGLRLQSYLDSGGVWTIGYGHTGGMPDGTKIGPKKFVTEDEADALLMLDVATHSRAVKDLIGNRPVTQSQFEALLDFSFNKGTQRLADSSLFKAFAQDDHLKASEEFLKWIYVTKKDATGSPILGPNGKPVMEVLPGLETRARENHRMMRAGFSSSILELLEIDRERDRQETRAINISANKLTGLKFHSKADRNLKQLETVAPRLDAHMQLLDKRIARHDSMLAKLKAERDSLVGKLQSHPALNNPHATKSQASAMMDIVGKIAVIDRVADRQMNERNSDLMQKTYYEDQRQLIGDTYEALSNAITLAQQGGAASQSELLDVESQLANAAQAWTDINQPGADGDIPHGAKRLASKVDVNSFASQLNALADRFNPDKYEETQVSSTRKAQAYR